MSELDINILTNKKIAKEYLLESLQQKRFINSIIRIYHICQAMGHEKGLKFCQNVIVNFNKKTQKNVKV